MIKEIIKTEMKKVDTVESVHYFCDLCGIEIKRQRYDIGSNKVAFKEGEWYPEGGSWEKESAYFCNTCVPKIKKVLEDIGVRFYHTECDG
jgi:hypothetical protein